MKLILVAAACYLALSGAAFADAYKLDAKGKCHAGDGKYAKQSMCTTATPAATYKIDTKGKCRNAKGHFADAKLCKV